MVRRGVAGGSDEELTRERQLAIDAYCMAQLRELGSDFPYAELFTGDAGDLPAGSRASFG